MIARKDAESMTYENSKKVVKFYKKVDRKIERACRKGKTGVFISRGNFDKDIFIKLLKPYYDDGYTLITSSADSLFHVENVLVGVSIFWN